MAQFHSSHGLFIELLDCLFPQPQGSWLCWPWLFTLVWPSLSLARGSWTGGSPGPTSRAGWPSFWHSLQVKQINIHLRLVMIVMYVFYHRLHFVHSKCESIDTRNATSDWFTHIFIVYRRPPCPDRYILWMCTFLTDHTSYPTWTGALQLCAYRKTVGEPAPPNIQDTWKPESHFWVAKLF